MRRQGLAVLVLLLAFSLRLIHLQSRPLWYDEAFAVLYAGLSPARMVYGTATPTAGAGAADVHPLLYYFLLHGWMTLAGGSPLAARFLSVALGMVTIALFWRLAAEQLGRPTAAVVGLLAATSPFHIAYSQEARMYALLGLAVVLTTWALLPALEAPQFRGQQTAGASWLAAPGHRRWALYSVGAALTLYGHNLGIVFLLALHLLALTRRRWRRNLPTLALADLVAVALFAPWLILVLPGQVGFVGRGYWLAPPGWDETIRAVMLPVLTFYEPAPFWVLSLGLLVSLLLGILTPLRICRTRSQAGRFLLLGWAPALTLFLLSLWRPLYLERALLPSALLYLAAWGWLLGQGGLPRLVRLGLTTLLAVAILGSLLTHYTYVGFPRPPFQEAAAYLRSGLAPGDAVVHTNKLTYFPMRVHAPDLPGAFLADPPGSPQDTLAYPTQQALGIFATPTITQAVGEAGRAWLVYFPREVQEMGENHPALAWVKDRFVLLEETRFSDLVVALYQRQER